MFEFHPISYKDRSAFYRELRSELTGLYEPTWFTNLANASAAIQAHLPRLNWVGFYLLVGEELRLGPFQGLPACLRIPLDKGVCGRAARERQTQRVDDVHQFAGHIACDPRSRSEIVLPLVFENRLLGVLDLDSPEVARFDELDQIGLENLVRDLVVQTNWPQSFAD